MMMFKYVREFKTYFKEQLSHLRNSDKRSDRCIIKQAVKSGISRIIRQASGR